MTEPTEEKGSIHSDMECGVHPRTEGTMVTNDGIRAEKEGTPTWRASNPKKNRFFWGHWVMKGHYHSLSGGLTSWLSFLHCIH